MNTYQSLSYRKTVELICRLRGGTAGFDYGRFRIADLRAMLATAIADGTYDADQVETVAADIAAEASAPAQPFGTSEPAPARVLPKLGKPAATPAAPLGTVHPIDFDGNQTGPAVPLTQADVDAIRGLRGCVMDAPVAPAPAIPVFAPAPVAPAPVAQPLGVIAPLDVPMEPAPAVAAPAAPPKAVPAPVAVAPAPAVYTPATANAPARMPLGITFPKVKLPALAFADCAMYAHPDAPAIDAHFQFDADALTVALAAADAGEKGQPINTWFHGLPGTGKTEFTRQFAARTGRPWFRIQFDRNIERAEFVGSVAFKGGETVWQDGVLLHALATPGAVICLDELTYAQQGNIAVLNGILEPAREYRINETGVLFKAADGVIVFACDNTNGTGDTSGMFVGTSPINPATLDRFNSFVRFDYLGKANEARILRDRTQMSKDGAEAIANLLHVCRQRAESGTLQSAPSLRQACTMAILMSKGIPAQAAYETAVVGRAIQESAEELRNLFSAHWPSTLNPAFATFTTTTPAGV